jgi:hypothetical protein
MIFALQFMSFRNLGPSDILSLLENYFENLNYARALTPISSLRGCMWISPTNICTSEPTPTKLGLNIVVLESISTACFRNPSSQRNQNYRLSDCWSKNSVSTLWSESANGDRCSSAKLVPTFADRACHVVSATDPYGRILGFLDQNRYFFFQVAP